MAFSITDPTTWIPTLDEGVGKAVTYSQLVDTFVDEAAKFVEGGDPTLAPEASTIAVLFDDAVKALQALQTALNAAAS
jgi:hypothetical protein